MDLDHFFYCSVKNQKFYVLFHIQAMLHTEQMERSELAFRVTTASSTLHFPSNGVTAVVKPKTSSSSSAIARGEDDNAGDEEDENEIDVALFTEDSNTSGVFSQASQYLHSVVWSQVGDRLGTYKKVEVCIYLLIWY